MTVVTPSDRPKSVHNRCVIELFGDVFFFFVVLPFWHFCWHTGFYIGLSRISSFFPYSNFTTSGLPNEIKYYSILLFTTVYYSKLYFTTENFTTWKVLFSTKLEPIIIHFGVRKLTIFFFFDINLCTIVWIQHRRNIFKWLKNILLKIEIPCNRYFSCSKVFCSKEKFPIVYYSKL